MSPFIPHLISECLYDLNAKNKNWPIFEKKYLEKNDIQIVIQINGKKRSTIQVEPNMSEKKILEKANMDEKTVKSIDNKTIFKYIYIKNRLINFIIK